MSPIAEKLAAVLADWDEMVEALADARKQVSAKEEAIVNLQQQYIRQASEITTLRGKISVLEMQVADAVMSAADPDDAKLLSRIEAAYATLTPRANSAAGSNGSGSGKTASGSSSAAATAAQIAVSLSPPVPSAADVPVPAAAVAKSGSGESATTKPARSATPGKAPSLRDVVFKLVE